MKIKFAKLIFVIFIGATIFASSCSSEHNRVDEGTVVYDISYPVPFEDKWLERLMPKEMEMKFKKEKLKTELSFGLGMIKIAYLSDQKKKELNEMMKFMKKKNFALRNHEAVNLLMAEIPQHKITPGNASKMIAGYECKNAIVEVKDDTTDYQFELWYTEDLGGENFNWCSPFSPINGVLMEYQIERFNVTMKFSAKKVELTELADDEFIVPDNYSEITYQQMRENIEQLKEI